MIELEVPFAEKDQAKALGAKWNPSIKKWYIPDTLESKASQFSRWLSPSILENLGLSQPIAHQIQQNTMGNLEPTSQASTSLESKGITLSTLMHKVQGLLRGSFAGGVWVKAEIANINERRGHYYLELVETNELGQQLAHSRAVIWANQADHLLSKFEAETHSKLEVGQSVLLLVEVNLHEKYGFSLIVQDIDASFTLGVLEAKLNQIRKQLITENLYDSNKRFSLPSDFFRVAVIAPPQAAGLGDFRADADILQKQGLCEFHYFYSAFQGEQCQVEQEMQAAFSAFQAMHASNPFEALVIIRGGGAKLDLTPLNSYEIAKHIALAELPILTGIGHERDNTILDEVAAVRFDTPSKVIAAIRQTIFKQAQQAKLNWIQIEQTVQQQLQTTLGQLNHFEQSIQHLSQKHLDYWRQQLQPLWLSINHQSQQNLQQAKHKVAIYHQQLIQETKYLLNQMNHHLMQYQKQVQIQTQSQLKEQKQQLAQNYQVIQNQVKNQLKLEKQQVKVFYETVKQQAPKHIRHQKQAIQQWMGFILSSGPQTQMQRGFVVVKDTQGHPIKSAQQALKKQQLVLLFKDGQLLVQILNKNH